MSSPASLIATAAAPGLIAKAATAAADSLPIDVGEGGVQPGFAALLRQLVKTLAAQGVATSPVNPAATDAPTLALPAQLLADLAAFPGNAAAQDSIPTPPAAVAADAAVPAVEGDLAALLAQLAPAARHGLSSRQTAPAGQAAEAARREDRDAVKVAPAAPGLASGANPAAFVPLVLPGQLPTTLPTVATPTGDLPAEGDGATRRSPLPSAREPQPLAKASGFPTAATPLPAEPTVPATPTAIVAERAAPGEAPPTTAIVAAPATPQTNPAVLPAASEAAEKSFASTLSLVQGGETAMALAAGQAAAQAVTPSVANTVTHNVVPTLAVDTPVGHPAWTAEIGDKLTWMVGRQEQRVELVLNPPQLGRVEVTLSLHGDQATAQFVSTNPEVRQALESSLPRLREVLAGSGISLGQTNVGGESSGQSASRRENGDNPPSFFSGNSLGEPPLRIGATSTQWLTRGRGLVDLFA
jgi:flagellar hook-length control protein FliK